MAEELSSIKRAILYIALVSGLTLLHGPRRKTLTLILVKQLELQKMESRPKEIHLQEKKARGQRFILMDIEMYRAWHLILRPVICGKVNLARGAAMN